MPVARLREDPAAAGFAALFARHYLTWDAGEPQASQQALAPFFATDAEVATAPLTLPSRGSQRVEWVEVVQDREGARAQHVYTVAAQTNNGLTYLAVTVARTAGGSVALGGYPAFVAAPASEASNMSAHLAEVADQSLTVVVTRALGNYLADSPSELRADLVAGSPGTVSSLALSLDSVQRIGWAQPGHVVLARLQAHDRRGVEYILDYEVVVVRVLGRWEVASVEIDNQT